MRDVFPALRRHCYKLSYLWWISVGHDQEDFSVSSVTDPTFAAIQYIVWAFFVSFCLQGKGVRAGLGLGQTEWTQLWKKYSSVWRSVKLLRLQIYFVFWKCVQAVLVKSVLQVTASIMCHFQPIRQHNSLNRDEMGDFPTTIDASYRAPWCQGCRRTQCSFRNRDCDVKPQSFNGAR